MAKKQIINPLVGFGQRAIGPYANRIGQSTYARNVNVGELEQPADFQAFGTVGNVIKALVRGVGSVTFARSTEAVVTDFEGVEKTALENEIRVEGARRVHNLCTDTGKSDYSLWDEIGVTISPPNAAGESTISGMTAAAANRAAEVFLAGQSIENEQYRGTTWIKGEGANIGKDIIFRIQKNSGGGTAIASTTYTLTADFQRITTPILTGVVGNVAISARIYGASTNNATECVVKQYQLQEITNQSNQNPDEYVPVGEGVGVEVAGQNATQQSYWDNTWNSGIISTDGTTLTINQPTGSGASKIASRNAQSPQEVILNKRYVVSCNATKSAGDSIRVSVGTSFGDALVINGTGFFEGVLTATTNIDTDPIRLTVNNTFVGTITDLSIKEADHGVFVDGVRQYATTNPNETINSVVTPTAATTPLDDWRFLFEPAATSYINEPEDYTLGANWSATGNMSGSITTTDSPLQGRKYWKIAPTVGSTGTHTYISNTRTKDAANETWIASIIVEADDVEVPWIALTAENSAGSNFGKQFFRLSDGLKGTASETTWTLDDSGSEALKGGARRYWVKVTTNTDTSIRLRVSAADGDNGDFFNLDVGLGFLVQGANLVEENALSSYIGGTGLTAYTRTGDDASPMFDYANWEQGQGTWLADIWCDPTQNNSVIDIRDSTGDGVLRGNSTGAVVTSDGTNTSTAAGVIVDSGRHRVVTDFNTGDSELFAGGRDIDGAGTWVFGSTAPYDGAFVTTSVFNIAFGITAPIRFRGMEGYTSNNKGQQWLEDNR